MGLTIHWSFYGPSTAVEVEGVIEKLRQRALDLPFESVSELAHFQDEQTEWDPDDDGDQLRSLKIAARRFVFNEDRTAVRASPPDEMIGFEIDVAPGSECMEVYLAAYPPAIPLIEIPSGPGWSATAFCKTQYASDEAAGGVPNFLRAHLSVCRLLDHARDLGILARVTDEGGFFTGRDVPALVSTVGEWNRVVLGTAAALEEYFGRDGIVPLRSFPRGVEAEGLIDDLLRFFKKRRGQG